MFTVHSFSEHSEVDSKLQLLVNKRKQYVFDLGVSKKAKPLVECGGAAELAEAFDRRRFCIKSLSMLHPAHLGWEETVSWRSKGFIFLFQAT